jgi:hypothetical protein
MLDFLFKNDREALLDHRLRSRMAASAVGSDSRESLAVVSTSVGLGVIVGSGSATVAVDDETAVGTGASVDEAGTIVGKGGCEPPPTGDWQAISQTRPTPKTQTRANWQRDRCVSNKPAGLLE